MYACIALSSLASATAATFPVTWALAAVRRDEPIVHISTLHAEPPIDWLRLKLLLRDPWNDCVLVSGLAAGPQTSVSLPPAWLGAAIVTSSASVAPAIARIPAAPIPHAFALRVERR